MAFRPAKASGLTEGPASLSARIHAALASSAKTSKAAPDLKEPNPARANVSKSPIKRANLRELQGKVARGKPKEVTCSFEDLLQRTTNSASPERRGALTKAGFTTDFLEPEDSASFRDSFVHSNKPPGPQLRAALTMQRLSPANSARSRKLPEEARDQLNTSGTTQNSSRVEVEAEDRQLIQTLSKKLGLEGQYQLIPSDCPLPSTLVVRSAQGYQVYDLRRT